VMKGFIFSALLFLLPLSANAEIIAGDWKVEGDGLAVVDLDEGKEWLKLNQTSGMTMEQISSMMGAGGQFEGWRFPDDSEIITMINNSFGMQLFDPASNDHQTADRSEVDEDKLSFFMDYMNSSTKASFAVGFATQDGSTENADARAYGVRLSSWSLEIQVGRNHDVYGYNKNFSSDYGIWLVADGGTTITGRDYNLATNVNAPVSLAALSALLFFMSASRRKSKQA